MDRRLASRRAIVALSTAALLVGVVGVPAPIVVAEQKDLSTPFPCQNRPCGCRSAEACWTGCCCFTRAERIAWCHQHGIEPPAALLESSSESAKPGRSCCSAGGASCETASSCCSVKGSCCKSSTCSKDGCSQGDACGNTRTCCEKPKQVESAKPTTIAWILPALMRRCQGHAELWQSLGAITPPPAIVLVELDLTFCEARPLADTWAHSLAPLPDVPPPRV